MCSDEKVGRRTNGRFVIFCWCILLIESNVFFVNLLITDGVKIVTEYYIHIMIKFIARTLYSFCTHYIDWYKICRPSSGTRLLNQIGTEPFFLDIISKC